MNATNCTFMTQHEIMEDIEIIFAVGGEMLFLPVFCVEYMHNVIVVIGFAVACLICKRLTDDEASRLFLYLQKLSREWSLLNNVTWDRVGSAVADATYGGFVIITSALFIGKLSGDLPTRRRITEMIFVGLGALLFVILGSLEFASIDSVPPDLVDNAAILGTLSLITAALFLLDLGGPKAKDEPQRKAKIKNRETPVRKEMYDVESEIQRRVQEQVQSQRKKDKKNGVDEVDERKSERLESKHNGQNGYTKMKEAPVLEKEKERPRFDIYGKDFGETDRDSDDLFDDSSSKAELHSPVWSNIRRGQYGKYDVVSPTFLYPKKSKNNNNEDSSPSGPGDPGYVQYTAQRWGQPKQQKTPRHSPTEV